MMSERRAIGGSFSDLRTEKRMLLTTSIIIEDYTAI